MRNKDSWVGAAVAAVCFLIYLSTLYPGVVGTADTPRLQLVGPVLGTAHTPGYPIYTLVAHLFSLIPFGSYAYRANLMSACFAALAVGLTFGLARRIEVPTRAAAVGALAMGFGPVFWSQALLAEVYSFGASVVAGLLLGLIAWASTGRRALLFGAAVCFGVGLGHRHVDVITALPGVLLFLYLSRRERPLNLRDAVTCAGIGAAGILSYSYIVVRTAQGAPYLATRASNLAELFVAWRGGPFTQKLFAFGPGELLSARLPTVGDLVLDELSFVGVGLASLGSWALGQRLPRETLLLLLTLVGNAFFVLNYAATDLAVFLIPSFVVLWSLVASGVGELARYAGRLGPRWHTAAFAALALLPAWQLASHYRANDHHERTLETRFLDALFEALPSRAALVRENDIVDSMLLYGLLAEGAGKGRDIILIPGDQESVEATAARGYDVFAFPRSAQDLGAVGFGFVPVTLLDEPLAERLAGMRVGTPAVVAGTSSAAGVLEVLAAIGARPAGRGTGVVAAGSIGGRGHASLGSAVELELQAGVARRDLEWIPAAQIHAATREGAAVIRVGSDRVLRTEDGVAAVLLAPGGRVTTRLEADPREEWRLPFTVRPLALRRLAFPRSCSKLDGGWRAIGDYGGTGRLQIRGRLGGSARLYLGRRQPLSPRTPGGSLGGVEITHLALGAERTAALDADGIDASQFSAAPLATRVSIVFGADPISVDLGGVPDIAIARAEPGGQVCAMPTAGASHFEGDRVVEKLDLTSRGTPFLGDGWGAPREDGPFFVRALDGQRGELLIPSAAAMRVRVLLQARVEGATADSTLELLIGNHTAGSHTVTSAWRDYEWSLSERQWQHGTNVLALELSSGRLSVRKLHFVRD